MSKNGMKIFTLKSSEWARGQRPSGVGAALYEKKWDRYCCMGVFGKDKLGLHNEDLKNRSYLFSTLKISEGGDPFDKKIHTETREAVIKVMPEIKDILVDSLYQLAARINDYRTSSIPIKRRVDALRPVFKQIGYTIRFINDENAQF